MSDTIADWTTKCGYRAVARGSFLGGLVGLDGKTYTDSMPGPITTKAFIERKSQLKIDDFIETRGAINTFCLGLKDGDELVSIELFFGVHGGITYMDSKCSYPVDNPGLITWVGFDCNHAGDNPTKCDIAFVENQCELLAEQLFDYAKEANNE